MTLAFVEWALDWKGKEHVYLSNFVSHFKLSNRESATQLFEELLRSSHIPQKRRQKLQAAYNYFKDHKEEQFWTKHSLRLNSERTAQRLALAAQDTAVEEAEAAYGARRLAIAAESSSTASVAKASISDPEPNFKRTGKKKTVFDNDALPFKSTSQKRKFECSNTAQNEEVTVETAISSGATSSATATIKKPHRRPSISSRVITEADFQIDLSIYTKEIYQIAQVDVGQLFYNHQLKSANLINRLSVKATADNIHFFLATNHIFDLTAKAPEGMTPETFEIIKGRGAVEVVELPKGQEALCISLGRELARTGRVALKLFDDPAETEIMLLFHVLVTKLVRKSIPSDKEYEDTFAHTTFDPFWTSVFPTDSDYTIGWANEIDEGSRARRKDGYKPDGYLTRMHVTLCFVEIKSPRQVYCNRDYIEDYWKLAIFCKDGIDDHIRNGRGVHRVAAVQVFGHQMSVYTMELRSGIYHWCQLGASYLPVDRMDGSRVLPCLELLRSLKIFLDDIDIVLMTPPRDGGSVKTTVLSPTKRPFF